MMNIKTIYGLLLSLLMVANAGVSYADNKNYPVSLRISTFAFVDKDGKTQINATPLVARVLDEGWLESELNKRGVKLEWVPITGNDTGALTNEAFASGRIDFANIGDLPSVLLNSGGIRTVVVAPTGRGGDMELLVAKDAPYKSIHDLVGKTISVHRGRPWDLGLRKLIESEGFKVSNFKIVNLNPSAGTAALAAGNVDAFFTNGGGANGGELLESKGIGKIIWTTKGKPLHFKYRAEIWGTRDFIDKYPDLTQLVTTAFVKASYWAAQDKNKEAIIQIATRNGTPEDVVRRTYDDPTLTWKDRWSPLVDGVVSAHYHDVVDAAYAQQLISAPLNADELVDARFVNQALKDLKLENYWTPW